MKRRIAIILVLSMLLGLFYVCYSYAYMSDTNYGDIEYAVVYENWLDTQDRALYKLSIKSYTTLIINYEAQVERLTGNNGNIIQIIKTDDYHDYCLEKNVKYFFNSNAERTYIGDYYYLDSKVSLIQGDYYLIIWNSLYPNRHLLGSPVNYSLYVKPTVLPVIDFKCSVRSNNSQKIIWNKVAGATGYQVQCSDGGTKWAQTKIGTANSVTFKGLTAGRQYKFRVRAYKDIDNQRYFSPWSKTLNSPTLPTGTTLTKLTSAKKAFNAQWKKNSAVNGYQIQYGVKSNFSGAKTLTVKNAKTLKAAVKKLNAKKVYYVRIRTYKTISKANYFSAWSKTYKVKTK